MAKNNSQFPIGKDSCSIDKKIYGNVGRTWTTWEYQRGRWPRRLWRDVFVAARKACGWCVFAPSTRWMSFLGEIILFYVASYESFRLYRSQQTGIVSPRIKEYVLRRYRRPRTAQRTTKSSIIEGSIWLTGIVSRLKDLMSLVVMNLGGWWHPLLESHQEQSELPRKIAFSKGQ